MTDTQIVELGLQAMTVAAKMCAPVLLTALLVGFAISLFQSVISRTSRAPDRFHE